METKKPICYFDRLPDDTILLVYQFLISHVSLRVTNRSMYKLSHEKTSRSWIHRVMEKINDPHQRESAYQMILDVQPPTADSIYAHAYLLEISAGYGVTNAAVVKQMSLRKHQEAMRLGYFRSSVAYTVIAQKFRPPKSPDYIRLDDQFWTYLPEIILRADGGDAYYQRQVNALFNPVDMKKLPKEVKRYVSADAFNESYYNEDVGKKLVRGGRHLQAASMYLEYICLGEFKYITPLGIVFRDYLGMQDAYRILLQIGVKIGNVWCMMEKSSLILDSDLMGAIDLLADAAQLGNLDACRRLRVIFSMNPNLDPYGTLYQKYLDLEAAWSR